MNLEDFRDKLMDDDELLFQIPRLKDYLNDNEFFNHVYKLCRGTYLTQYNAKIFKDENGEFVSLITHESFKELGDSIVVFINNYLKEFEADEIFEELLVLLKNNYINTAKSEEIKSRSHFEKYDNKGNFGLYGTYFNFNEIDWDSFTKGIKENIKL